MKVEPSGEEILSEIAHQPIKFSLTIKSVPVDKTNGIEYECVHVVPGLSARGHFHVQVLFPDQAVEDVEQGLVILGLVQVHREVLNQLEGETDATWVQRVPENRLNAVGQLFGGLGWQVVYDQVTQGEVWHAQEQGRQGLRAEWVRF